MYNIVPPLQAFKWPFRTITLYVGWWKFYYTSYKKGLRQYNEEFYFRKSLEGTLPN